MIAWAPGRVPAAATSAHVWAHWDLLPTLADLAGTTSPPGMDGLSMRGALEGRPATAPSTLLGVSRTRVPAGRPGGEVEGPCG